MNGYVEKYQGIKINAITRDQYRAGRDNFKKSLELYRIIEDNKIIFQDVIYGFLDLPSKEIVFYLDPYRVDKYLKYQNHGWPDRTHMRTPYSYHLDQAIARARKEAEEQAEAEDWVNKQLRQLSAGQPKRTFYAVAHLRMLGVNGLETSMTKDVVIPIDVYETDAYGCELGRVAQLVCQCPWDVERTKVRIDTAFIHVDDLLSDIIDQDVRMKGGN